jgi:hypothetical protein
MLIAFSRSMSITATEFHFAVVNVFGIAKSRRNQVGDV